MSSKGLDETSENTKILNNSLTESYLSVRAVNINAGERFFSLKRNMENVHRNEVRNKKNI